jgi:hypothetical protein
MNDKLLNISMIIFFAGMLINALLIMISLTPNGNIIYNLTIVGLEYDTLSNNCTLAEQQGFISNTQQSQDASSFSTIKCINPNDSVNVGDIFAGVNAVNQLFLGMFLLETVFYNMGRWFPIFLPIFWGLASVAVGAKILLIGYAGSILLNALFGRR